MMIETYRSKAAIALAFAAENVKRTLTDVTRVYHEDTDKYLQSLGLIPKSVNTRQRSG